MDLIKNKVYLVNGELLNADEAAGKGVNVNDATLRDNTISFGIMSKHNTSDTLKVFLTEVLKLAKKFQEQLRLNITALTITI